MAKELQSTGTQTTLAGATDLVVAWSDPLQDGSTLLLALASEDSVAMGATVTQQGADWQPVQMSEGGAFDAHVKLFVARDISRADPTITVSFDSTFYGSFTAVETQGVKGLPKLIKAAAGNSGPERLASVAGVEQAAGTMLFRIGCSIDAIMANNPSTLNFSGLASQVGTSSIGSFVYSTMFWRESLRDTPQDIDTFVGGFNKDWSLLFFTMDLADPLPDNTELEAVPASQQEADAKALLLSQFQDKANLEALLGALIAQTADAERGAFEVLPLRQLDLDNLSGVQLDIVGRIVGQPRRGQVDDTYRLWLKGRIAVNTSSGTTDEMLSLLKLLLPNAQVDHRITYPASIRFTATPVTEDVQALTSIVTDAAAGGVQVSFEHLATARSTAFLWGVAAQGFGDDAQTTGGLLTGLERAS